jgi:hypothetical protein
MIDKAKAKALIKLAKVELMKRRFVKDLWRIGEGWIAQKAVNGGNTSKPQSESGWKREKPSMRLLMETLGERARGSEALTKPGSSRAVVGVNRWHCPTKV